ncbi:MAG: HEPN domain-containing protein [bacterium]
MRRNKEEARRWLQQAKKDLEIGKSLGEMGEYAYACFHLEQAGQKALKSFLYFVGKRYIWEHSIFNLAKQCREYDAEFKELLDAGKYLDRFYLTTRYPDAVAPPALPYELFTEEDFQKALELSEKIFKFVERKISP